jgi:DNA recombination protein RmuC
VDQTVLLFIVAAVIVGFTMMTVVISWRLRDLKGGGSVDLMKADVTELSRTVAALQQHMGDRLDRNSNAMQMSVQRQLSESAKLVADVSSRLTKLDETNRQVMDVASELKTLQNVLQNPKQRGVFGEYYLQTVLENVLAPGQFAMQHKFADGEVVDAVIFLEKGQILPIDSKFSLENYNRMIEAPSKPERERLLLKVKADLKGRIDETSKYIRRDENTMDFAFMFIPSESLYYHLLVGDVGSGGSARDLIEYAFRDRRVIIVSPTSFMAYLQTVMQGLRSLQIEEQAKDIQVRVGKLGQHMARFEEYMQKLGGALSTTVNHYNVAHNELGKVDKDIVKIAGSTSAVHPVLLERPYKDEQDQLRNS